MKVLKFIIGLIVLIVVIIIVLVIMQSQGLLTSPELESIRTTGILTWFKNLWLNNVTTYWNEQIVPIWK